MTDQETFGVLLSHYELGRRQAQRVLDEAFIDGGSVIPDTSNPCEVRYDEAGKFSVHVL